MEFSTLALLFSLVWVAIYSLHYLLSLSPSRSLLPIALLRSGHPPVIRQPYSTKVVLNLLHLRVETAWWNFQHDSLAAFLAGRRNSWAKILIFFYNFGSALCLLGMIGSLTILIWTCWELSTPVRKSLLRDVATSGHSPDTLVKRSLRMASGLTGPDWPTNLDAPFLRPIIPGVTVPLSHLPSALAAVFIAQAIHEIGHTVCAALESVPILSVGASLFIIVPSAFVRLSSAAIEVLAPAGRLRIVAAGPFHNLVFWCILVVAGNTGIGRTLWSISYRDISAMGRVVITVEPHSPLHDHLPRGSFITALDDLRLGGSKDTPDIWATFAAKPEIYTTNGWCVQRSWYLGMSRTCCAPDQDKTESFPLSCFTSLELYSAMRCLDPIPILTVDNDRNTHRCASGVDCADDSLCVRPLDSEQLSRVTIQLPPWLLSHSNVNEEVILWKGPRSELLKEVEVGTLFPRLRFFPLWLPSVVHLFFDYLKMATLSFYFFNLLPLPLLDGAKMLDILFAIPVHLTPSRDVEAITASGRPISTQRKCCRWLIHLNVAVFLGLAVTFTFLNFR